LNTFPHFSSENRTQRKHGSSAVFSPLRNFQRKCLPRFTINPDQGELCILFLILVVPAGAFAQRTILKPASPQIAVPAPRVDFNDIAEAAGLTAKTEAGGDKAKKYILETTGSGAAFVPGSARRQQFQ
jgi:hypothetical protein